MGVIGHIGCLPLSVNISDQDSARTEGEQTKQIPI